MNRRSSVCVAVLMASLLARPAVAQPRDAGSALINQALDQPVNLELNTSLQQAIKTITNKTGVPIVPDRAVWDLIPWADQTNVTAKIDGKSLRVAIDLIARHLGLTAETTEQGVALHPMPALMRMGRRATLEELAALDLLASMPIDLGTGDHQTIQTVVDAIEAKLTADKSPYAVAFRPGDVVRAEAAVSVPRNATMGEALECVARDTAATWYPWGHDIVVVPKQDQIRLQLGKTINARYNGVGLQQVLLELSQSCGVDFDIEPGSVQHVPAEQRSVRLLLDNATVEQALNSICSFTGLSYDVTDRGVYLWNPTAVPGEGGISPRDPVAMMLPMPGGGQLLVTQSQLPPDVRVFLQHHVAGEVQKIRGEMRAEGFQFGGPGAATEPTTMPASTPTTMR